LTHLLILIPLSIHLIPLPPSPKREEGIYMIFFDLAPLPWERGWGEVKEKDLFFPYFLLSLPPENLFCYGKQYYS